MFKDYFWSEAEPDTLGIINLKMGIYYKQGLHLKKKFQWIQNESLNVE